MVNRFETVVSQDFKHRAQNTLAGKWPAVGACFVIALLAAEASVVPAFDGRVVTDETGRHLTIPGHPQRVVSLAPSVTETLYALGLGSILVGDTDYCDYPPEAKLKPHVGAVLNPSLEKIVALKPDLVLGSAEANRRETADQLERLGIPLYGLTARSLDDTLRTISDLGEVLGQPARAQGMVENLRKRIQAVEQRAAGQPRPKVLFVTWYRPLITAGPHTFVADVIRRAGGVSIADDLTGDWPRLSLEQAIARDPDVILFPKSESFSPALDEFTTTAGWKDLHAVKDHRMYFVSEAIIHPSPRLVDALEEVSRVLHPPASPAPGDNR